MQVPYFSGGVHLTGNINTKLVNDTIGLLHDSGITAEQVEPANSIPNATLLSDETLKQYKGVYAQFSAAYSANETRSTDVFLGRMRAIRQEQPSIQVQQGETPRELYRKVIEHLRDSL